MNLMLDESPAYCRSDKEFDAVYPLKIRKLSSRHWTPVEMAKRAADFLVNDAETRVLDIGSGVGKFCLAAAAYSQGNFTGVEQRENLVRLSQKIAKRFHLERVNFIHANIKNINFKDYDSFYFFNSFEENLDLTDKIDEDSHIDVALYESYCHYLYGQFEATPSGSKVVTYCTSSNIIPESYNLVKTGTKGKLKFWQKVS
jgi:SAM-dependent methyltransferase